VGHRLVVVMPAYNAAALLERTWRDVPRDVVDELIRVDDASRDRPVEIARGLGLTVIEHTRNRGYGANQKTRYRTAALERPCFQDRRRAAHREGGH
jgi:glycosyltransferase involved in cell wall biosynthesis